MPDADLFTLLATLPIEGGPDNDSLIGGSDNDVIKGYEGNDTLDGGAGDDTLEGGIGRDSLMGGSGFDYASYEHSSAGVIVDLASNTKEGGDALGDKHFSIEGLIGSAFSDTLHAASQVASHLIGNAGDDRLTGDGFSDTLDGGDGADILDGGDSNDMLLGGNGQDTLLGSYGADTLDGDDGVDWISYRLSLEGVSVSLADGRGYAGSLPGGGTDAEGDTYESIENVEGSNGNDVLAGNAAANHLNGLNGNDILQGGLGADTLQGGGGFNLASYANATSGVTASLADQGANSGEAAGDVYLDIQGLQGSAFGDLLVAGASGNALSGLSGNDTLEGGIGADALEGSDGDDVMTGGAGADRFDGGTGFDIVSFANARAGVTLSVSNGSRGDAAGDTYTSIECFLGSSFDDVFIGSGSIVMKGGLGNDTYDIRAGGVFEEATNQGRDTLIVGGSYVLAADASIEVLKLSGLSSSMRADIVGSSAANEIVGHAGANTLKGLAGNDVLDGGAGSDRLEGGTGNDTYRVDSSRDVVVEARSAGRDTVIASTSYALSSSAEVEVLKLSGVSSKKSASLTGSSTANELFGHAGTNTLKGQGGNDTLHGGSGNDKLYGGSGKDVFVFDTKPSKSANVDRIYDFDPKYDSLWLDNKYFTKLGSGSLSKPKGFTSDMFVKSTKAKDREDRIVYDKDTGALYYDADGTGSKAQVKIATLSKNLKLTYHDFFVI